MHAKLSRKLGFWETICTYGHECYAGTGNVTSVAHLTGALQLSQCTRVLQALFNRHPLLRAVIVVRAYENYFDLKADFKNIPIVYQEILNSEEWQSHVETEMGEKFPQETHLWRAKILYCPTENTSQVILTFHHAIADGLSTAFLMREFLESLAGDNSDKPSLPLLDAIEEMLADTNDWPTFLKQKIDLKERMPEGWPYHEFARINQRVTKTIFRELSADHLNHLKNKVKHEGTTINSALNAALLSTIADLKQDAVDTTLHTPVNLRRYCEPVVTEDYFGCYISMITTVHQQIRSGMNFWQLARDYQQQLQANIVKTGLCPKQFNIRDFDIEQITEIFDMPGSTKRKFYSGGFGITNLGNVEFEKEYGALKLNSFMFCTNRAMGDYVMFLNVLSMHGTMKLCFCYAEPLLSEEWALRFVDQFMWRLEEL